jgi:hypothetical protein
MTNPFLSKQNLQTLQKKLKIFVNNKSGYLLSQNMKNPRSVGDGIEDLIKENINEIFSDPNLEYTNSATRRSMADFTITDKNGFGYSIDIKSHNLDAKFSMPNLTANRGLVELYDTPENVKPNYFMVMIFSYRVVGPHIVIEDVVFSPIENFDWSCLTIGALGWGQIQIKNSNNIVLNYSKTRKQWMIELCDKMLVFYPNEVEKIGNRIEYFKEVKKKWLNKAV